MEDKKTIQAEAKRLVCAFKKDKEKGEFRNEIGRVWWPMWHSVVIPVLSSSLIGVSCVTGNVPFALYGVALWMAGRFFTKGFAINVQNIAIKNAGVLGRSLGKEYSAEVKKEAVLEYLRQSGSWFFNKKWVKQHPEEISKMAEGRKGEGIPDFVALMEYSMNRIFNHKQKNNEKVSLRDRLQVYQQAYMDYVQTRKKQRF